MNNTDVFILSKKLYNNVPNKKIKPISENSIYVSLRWILCFLKMFGAFPFGKDTQDQNETANSVTYRIGPFIPIFVVMFMPIFVLNSREIVFHIKSITTLYSVTVSVVMTAFSMFSLINDINHELKVDIDLSDYTVHYGAFIIKAFHIIPLLTFIERKRIIKYFKDWREFEDKYEETTGTHFKVSLLKFQLFIITWFLLTWCIITYYASNKWMAMKTKYHWDEGYYNVISLVYCFTLAAFYGILWFFLNKHIMLSSDNLIIKLKNTPLNATAIRKYRNLWMKLCQLTSNLGLSLGLTYSGFMLILFLINLVSLYMLVSAAIVGHIMALPICVTVSSIVFMSMIAEFSHLATNKVKETFLDYLLKQQEQKHGASIDEELDRFRNYIVSHPPEITIAGYSTLNRNFNLGVCGNYVTYVIIFIQMTPT